MNDKPKSAIDLNTDDESLLVKKLQISARLAKRIIALRPYQSVDQLTRVWGIDPETLQRIMSLVSVNQDLNTSDQNNEGKPDYQELQVNPGISELNMETDFQSSEPKEEIVVPNEPEKLSNQLSSPVDQKNKTISWKTNLVLALILLMGAYFRFTGLGWDENQHQHPDERFITMVTEQIRWAAGPGGYFDTNQSTLNPLRFGSYTYGMLPLFFTRMVAEWVRMSSYDSITPVGRAMSGLFDLAAVWMLYLLGKRLYNKRTGLLAAALGAAAVLPIQLSHYFAVDSFSTVFVVASFYFAIQAIPLNPAKDKFSRSNIIYSGIFGLFVGLAGACKVNTLPVFGVIFLAGIARLISSRKEPGFRSLLKFILLGWVLSVFCTFLAFRIFQPYAFSGPGFLGIELNQRWVDVMREVTDQVGGNSDWPPNHHWTNRSITYAWTNMVTWGLGLPLGLVGWLGWAWAAWRIWKGDWSRHLLPFVWVAAYFIWQNLQFWRYMRYFLPIYPFIILFAAWALMEIFDRTRESRVRLLANGTRFAVQFSDWRNTWKGSAGLLALGIVLAGTYGYAFAFTQIYNRPMTRIAASRWMLSNFPGPLNVIVDTPSGSRSYPVSISNRQIVEPGNPSTANIRVLQGGSTSRITSTDIRQVGVNIYFGLTRDEKGTDVITEGRLAINDDNQDEKLQMSFGDVDLAQDETYYFQYTIQSSSRFSLSNVIIRNVDQSLPAITVDLALENQRPGLVQGTLPIESGKSLKLNRFEIGKFHQDFMASEATLKVSLFKEGNENEPLVEVYQTLTFSQPGARLSPTIDFSPVDLNTGQIVRVRYEVTNGPPLRLSGESYTLETSWDDALPLNIDQYSAQGGIFTPLNLELYEPDTPQKRESMIAVLSESNYIVIPSNRAYDAMPRLPLRYPLTLKYYQTLFDCNCASDELENRAYGLEPPFKSPLGFDLIATFESSAFPGIFANLDQSADESFTVYDHPKVMIFKKSEDFSIDRIKTLLNDVDLDQVIFQTPMEYNQAPTAMQLTPDRLLAQNNAGTWSAMFDRMALINQNEVVGGVAWYFVLFLLGLLVFPITFNVFSGLPDRGYPLIRMAGLMITAWLAWFLSSLRILPFTQITLWLCIGAILILSIVIANRQRDALLKYFRSHWKYILVIEAIFLMVFLFDLSVRLGNPDLWNPWLGGEKPMNFAFFNSVLKAVYFPPENPWFSGHYLNYYYYGYVIAAIPTKLLGILPSIAYNLILPSWFAMTGIGVFCIGFNLVAGLGKKHEDHGLTPDTDKPLSRFKWVKQASILHGPPYLAGLLAIIAVLFLGNLYEFRNLWKYLPEATSSGSNFSSPVEHAGAFIGGAIQVLTGQSKLPGNNSRWYFDASRPILHDGPDTPIAEFPYFTFLYGDMHPHLLSMPIYGLGLGWILSLLLRSFSGMKWRERILSLVGAGIIFGSFRASHTWDFPTFIGLGIIVILWDGWRNKTDPIKRTLLIVLGYVAVFIGVAVAFYWPFAEWFRTEYVSLQFWNGLRTPLIDYLFVFGLSLFLMISFLIRDFYADIKAGIKGWVSASKNGFLSRWHLKQYAVILVNIAALGLLWMFDYQVLAFGLPLLVGITYLIFFKRELPVLRRISWILFGIGLALTLLVEVFVLKGDVGRSNMVFRFYNEAWFILGLGISVALVEMMLSDSSHLSKWIKTGWFLVLAGIILCAAFYPIIATNMKITDRWPDIQNPPHSLDGSAYMLGDAGSLSGKNPAIYNDDNRKINLSGDYAAIQYMQDHIFGSPVIVEAQTAEYRWGSRFSIYTGLPSVVGWSWHVRQHNSLLPGTIIEKRIDEVNNFYNTQDIQIKIQFLKRYEVQYIVVGDLERAYYDALGIAKFQEMAQQGIMRVAFNGKTQNGTTIYEVMGN